ncbi:8875_t:CDS:1, partial [Gigaspora margarita]
MKMEMYVLVGLTTTSSRPQYQSTIYVALANNSIVVVENQFGT